MSFLEKIKVGCTNCSMHELCLPMGLNDADMTRLDQIIGHRRILRGQHLYQTNDTFTYLYAVRVGHFKSYQINQGGEQQITGFFMAGELMGMDAISTERHPCNVEALEDSEVCDIPFYRLESLFDVIPGLLRHFHRIMSQEITREQNAVILLGNMRSEQRFAAFLLNLASRYAARGYAASEFQLRMSREDIGNYLGLTIESISRLIARFKKEGWVIINKREVQLLDMSQLKALAAGEKRFSSDAASS